MQKVAAPNPSCFLKMLRKVAEILFCLNKSLHLFQNEIKLKHYPSGHERNIAIMTKTKCKLFKIILMVSDHCFRKIFRKELLSYFRGGGLKWN